jgi:hypothetical protein
MARFPTSPKPSAIAINGTSPAFVMAAQNRHRKAVTQSAQYFELELDFPPLTRDEYSPIGGFLAKQRGPVGQFEYVPHTHALPRGLGSAAAEVATSNLVKWSERLDLSPWGYSDAVNIVQGTAVTAPDGTPTGQLWLVNAANVDSWPRMRQSFTTGQITGVVTVSVYMKAPAANATTRTYFRLYNGTTAGEHSQSINWSAGVPTLGSQTNIQSAELTAVGGGWYRMRLSANLTSFWDPSSHQFHLDIYPRVTQPGVLAGIHIWGAQVTMGALTTPAYLHTWSAAGSRNAGPRVSLRSNLIAFSQNFGGAYWVKGCAVLPATGPVLKKYGTAPDGGVAESWGTPAANGIYNGCLSRTVVAAAQSTQYVMSIYVKKDLASQCGINIYDVTAAASYTTSVDFDAAGVATITLAGGDASGIEPVGGGWYRVWMLLDAASRGLTGHALAAYIYPHSENDGDPRQPEGTYIWGAQFESGRVRPGHYMFRTSESSSNVELESGFTLHTEGWNANQVGVLKADDFVKLAGHTKVYKVTDDASSDANGLAKVLLDPALLETPAPYELLQVEDVPFLVTLASDGLPAAWDENVWIRPSVKLLEVI